MKQAALFNLMIGCLCAQSQQNNFVGGMVGVTTLSADGQTSITTTGSNVSLYKPENGITARFFYGHHLSDYFSLQGTYTFNRNLLTLTSLATVSGQESLYEQMRSSTLQMAGVEAMAYFRPRSSALRPYLSFGGGASHFASTAQRVTVQRGVLPIPPTTFTAVKPFVRVDVGIDMKLKQGWKFRYSFGESILRNPISVQLTPQGKRNLASFQNLFGFVKEF